MRDGTNPMRANKSRRRGLDDARTSCTNSGFGSRLNGLAALFETISDPALGQIIWRQFA